MPPSVLLLTNGSPHGLGLLEALVRRGQRPDVIAVVGGRGWAGPDGRSWLRRSASTVRRIARFHLRLRPALARRATRLLATGPMNSARMLADLRALGPDLVVLGGGGILAPEVIETARLGVINAHPALLPWMRGCGVVGHSLTHGVALGATIHRVDAGIDTGPILARRLLAPAPECRTLGTLTDRAHALAWEMAAEVVESIRGTGALPPETVQDGRWPLYTHATAGELAAQEALAASGEAERLYTHYRAACPFTRRD